MAYYVGELDYSFERGIVFCRSAPFLSWSSTNSQTGRVIFGPHADVNGTRAGLEKGFVAAGVAYKVLLKR